MNTELPHSVCKKRSMYEAKTFLVQKLMSIQKSGLIYEELGENAGYVLHRFFPTIIRIQDCLVTKLTNKRAKMALDCSPENLRGP